ncbi:Cation efflux system protein CusC [BD1-7 clade bacterium]|uniref:Cation efflux system protein CusC n=1 Tax=BD1-7 clade bacterium TaxID=2029982 RepID=A0A5S9NXC8_9GAMM|nr:Cation efflux system protein CusC [BD1-7 clade bacterium]CAA0095983.1 Cation efflux system protein CusC [BD1-7 clade bacterium]
MYSTFRDPKQSARWPRRLTLATWVSVAALSAGCAQFGDQTLVDDASADQQQVQSWQYQQTGDGDSTSIESVSYLTDLVRNPALIDLVIEGLNNSPDLKQTALALKIVYRQSTTANADRLPEVSAGFSANVQDQADVYTTSVNVSWELDLWGKINDGVLAAEADVTVAAANLEAARNALAANIMRGWLNQVLQTNRIAIETERLDVLERNETVIRQRYHKGLGTLEDLDTARSSSAQSRSRLVGYRETLAQQKRALRQLVGKLDADIPALEQSALPSVIQPLAGLPEQTLAGRPDLQAAYHTISASQYRTSVAYKSLLPSFSLSAGLTDSGSSPGADLLSSSAWNLLGNLTQPLFQGGRLKAQAEIAGFQAEQAYWAYRQNLLMAVTEVNDALGLEVSLTAQEQHLSDAYKSALRSATTYENRYRNGLANIIDLLTVQQRTFDLQEAYLQATYDRLMNRVDLGLSLGLGIKT